jgi:hypothetical protein
MVHEYTKLKNARYMGFSTVPMSKAAHALCGVVINQLTQQEMRTRARRAKDKANFEAAASSIIGDLMMAAVREEGGWAYRSVSKKSFSDDLIKGDTFNSIMNSLGALGYLDSVKGGNYKNPFNVDESSGFYPGMATRFRVTESFLRLSEGYGITLDVLKTHFKPRPSLQQIRLKGTASRLGARKESARSMRFEETDKTRAIKQQLLEINSFLIEQRYQGMEFYGLRRLFNEGDHPSFDWNLGGRLYGVGDDSYQMLKKAKRLDIKINGEAVVELDINASFLRILHGLRDFALPTSADIYAIEGIDRALVKAWVSCTFGHTKFHRAWPKTVVEELSKQGTTAWKEHSYPSLKPKVLEYFPVLRDWPECGIRWSGLMYEEAEAMITTMESLRTHGVVALPVHDSLIVPKSKGQLAERVMRKIFEARFGVDFIVNGLR